MPGKIFVNYRRGDVKENAARIRDRLAGVFGPTNAFMDVDNLLAGQRFDKELEKALSACDVFLAVIGPRWMELMKSRSDGDERDYVREEIAAALKRGILVIPVLIERTPLPRRAELPEDIREMVLHQKHDVTYERFGRDMDDLAAAIKIGRKAMRAEKARGAGSPARLALIGAIAAGLIMAVWVGVQVWSPWKATTVEREAQATPPAKAGAPAKEAAAAKQTADKANGDAKRPIEAPAPAKDAAAAKQTTTRSTPRPRPIEVSLLKEDGRTPFPIQTVRDLESRAALPNGQISWTADALVIEPAAKMDVNAITFDSIFRHHQVIDRRVKSPALVEIALRPRYVSLADLNFKFKNSAGGNEKSCDALLVVPQKRRLGRGWQRLKAKQAFFDEEDSIYLYNKDGRDAARADSLARAGRNDIFISTHDTDGEVRLQFRSSECRSERLSLAAEDLLGLTIERTTRPAGATLVAILSADEQIDDVVADPVQHQRLWNEIAELVNELAKTGPKTGAQWEKTAVVQQQLGELGKTKRLWRLATGNTPLFNTKSELLGEAELLQKDSQPGDPRQKRVQPIERHELEQILKSVHKEMGFTRGDESPTILLTFGRLVVKSRDSLCFHQDALTASNWLKNRHRLVAIELIDEEHGVQFLKDRLIARPSLAPPGVYACNISEASRASFQHLMLEIPTILQGAVLRKVIPYVRGRVSEFVETK